MSEDNVSAREFDRWVQLQVDAQTTLSDELKDISREIRETNTLLREDIAATKNNIENHIQVYNHAQQQHHSTFVTMNERIETVENVIKEQASVYRSAKMVKFVLGVILIGSLTTFGANLAGYINFGKQEPVKVTEMGLTDQKPKQNTPTLK